MQLKGRSRKQILEELERANAKNQRYEEGKIFCSMCTKPHKLAIKAYNMFLCSNLGDSGLFEGSAQLETDVINQLATLLHGPGAVGAIVSGGTEANLMALLAARNKTNIAEPEVILPSSVHFSFVKICNLLKVKPVYAELDSNFRADPSSVEKHISKRTIALVATAGTAELGVVDPIDKLSEIAQKHAVYFHVDAALGGLFIPFLPSTKPQFDFSLPAVASITVDPHKMGMAPIPAGGILFRGPQMLEYLKTETPYLTNRYQYTLVGTRTGASAASAWAVLNALGIEGFRKVVKSCIRTTKVLSQGITDAGLSLAVEPTLNIVAFRSTATKKLAERLWSQGWYVSYVPRYDCIRMVVMPHVKQCHVIAFLRKLRENL
ncbi:MAG: tyrosine decarboxylase MfnA [Candidatus Bathyarchaeota archaeon]|nr:tyrosine decarboxylase MfnA [Candidatus Bathyarchaeota archaeon]